MTAVLSFLPEACAVVAGLSPKTRGHRVRASYVARCDQVISHRSPSGSPMNAERPPHDRSLAAATGVAPAVTAASNALSTSSRVPAVQASVTPDHPVGAVLSGAA
jgi:hypothetical protein